VLLDPEPKAGAAEQAAPHIQVPAVPVAAGGDDGALALQGVDDIADAFLSALPALGPEGSGAGEWQRERPQAAAPPRRKTVGEPSLEPRERLQQVQMATRAIIVG
jgi:hypothetical protein